MITFSLTNALPKPSITSPKPSYAYLAFLMVVFIAIMTQNDAGKHLLRTGILFGLALPFTHFIAPKPIKIYAWFGLVFIGLSIFSNAVSPYFDGWRRAEGILHWLLIIPVAFIVIRSCPSKEKLFGILTIAMLASFCVALYDLSTGELRYHGVHGQPIPWGNLAILTGILCFYLSLQLPQKHAWMVGTLLLLIGLFTSGVSQTRGGWITIFTLAPFIIRSIQQKLPSKAFVFLSLIIASSVIGILSNDKLGINQRFLTGFENIQRYLNQEAGVEYSSIGNRFEMWKSSVRAFEERPLLGVGYRGFHQWINQDPAYRGGLRYKHAHSQYFSFLGSYGLLASLAFVVMIVYWLFWLYQHRNDHAEATPIFWLAAILTIAYLEFCLSESFWTSTLGSGYFIYLSVYLTILMQQTITQQNDGISIPEPSVGSISQ